MAIKKHWFLIAIVISDFLVDSNEAILFASSHSKKTNIINIVSIIVTVVSIIFGIIGWIM